MIFYCHVSSGVIECIYCVYLLCCYLCTYCGYLLLYFLYVLRIQSVTIMYRYKFSIVIFCNIFKFCEVWGEIYFRRVTMLSLRFYVSYW